MLGTCCRVAPAGESISQASIPVEARFVDLSWGGRQGEAEYPAFVNTSVIRAVEDPAGKPIQQEHDSEHIRRSLRACKARRPSAASARAWPLRSVARTTIGLGRHLSPCLRGPLF